MNAFLLEIGWKSSGICGLAFVLVELLRQRGPRDRARVLYLTLALLLLLPAVSLLGLHLPITVGAFSVDALSDAAAGPSARDAHSDWPVQSILAIYMCGAALVLCRLLVGLVVLRRWTARARAVSSSHWTEALSRVSRGAPAVARVRLLVSDSVTSPISWGWLRPTILIDHDTLGRTDEATGVLAHEVAHIVRRDWVMLVMSHLAVALFWFNPLVWLLKQVATQNAEEAADAAAVATIEPTCYAQMLLNSARRRSGVAMLAAQGMSCEPRGLSRRVRRVLDAPRCKPHTAGTLAAMAASAILAAPLAAAEFVPAVPVVRPSLAPPRLEAGPITSTAIARDLTVGSVDRAQAEADRLRAEANAAQTKALASGDPGEIGRANGAQGRADAAQGWVHALQGDLARKAAWRR